MKAEAEIRKHRDDLRRCMARPCNCEVSGHTAECLAGRCMMAVAAAALTWVLDDGAAYERVVEEMAAAARRL